MPVYSVLSRHGKRLPHRHEEMSCEGRRVPRSVDDATVQREFAADQESVADRRDVPDNGRNPRTLLVVPEQPEVDRAVFLDAPCAQKRDAQFGRVVQGDGMFGGFAVVTECDGHRPGPAIAFAGPAASVFIHLAPLTDGLDEAADFTAHDARQRFDFQKHRVHHVAPPHKTYDSPFRRANGEFALLPGPLRTRIKGRPGAIGRIFACLYNLSSVTRNTER